jgi:S1-C subfamily serine protease
LSGLQIPPKVAVHRSSNAEITPGDLDEYLELIEADEREWSSVPAPDYDRMQRSTVLVQVFDGDKRVGHGSGVLTPAGVLTAAHVIMAAEAEGLRIELLFYDGETAVATVKRHRFETTGGVYAVLSHDIALLEVKAPLGYAAAPIQCDPQRVGTEVYAVGAPANLRWAVTYGHVITNVPRDGFEQDAWIQTDAVIWRGNSGGPMFDIQGRVIGIVSHILSAGGGGSTGHSFGVSGPRVCEFLNGEADG